MDQTCVDTLYMDMERVKETDVLNEDSDIPSHSAFQNRFLFQPFCFYHAQPLPLSRVHAFKRKKPSAPLLDSASTTEPEKVLGLTSPCLAQ